jgi:hypothetical protein
MPGHVGDCAARCKKQARALQGAAPLLRATRSAHGDLTLVPVGEETSISNCLLQPNVHHQPALYRVGNVKAAAHALHRFVNNRQAQTGSGGGSSGGVASEER